jgi:hypothetical protein
MKMKMTVSVEISSPEQLESLTAFVNSENEKAPQGKPRGRPKAEVKAEETAAPVEETVIEDPFDTTPAAPEPKKEEAKPVTFEQMVAAFKDYAQREGKDNAIKILSKLKVKSVKEIKQAEYATAMKLLGQ